MNIVNCTLKEIPSSRFQKVDIYVKIEDIY